MPPRRGPGRYILNGTIVAVVAVSGLAHADEKQRCVAASVRAQQLRNASKLAEARDELIVCGRTECPKLIQRDCTEWMKEILGIVPTVVLSAKDRDGRDIVDARVSIDGKVVAETLDGSPLSVDPGVHIFRFETPRAPPVEEKVVIRQGEKNRLVTITFATPVEKEPESKKPLRPVEVKNSPPYAAYLVGGAGILTLGAALYVDLAANAEARKLRETCAPTCAQSQVDSVENRYVIAGVTAAVGGALLIVGVVLFFTHSSSSKSSALRLLPTLAPTAGGAVSGAGFRF